MACHPMTHPLVSRRAGAGTTSWTRPNGPFGTQLPCVLIPPCSTAPPDPPLAVACACKSHAWTPGFANTATLPLSSPKSPTFAPPAPPPCTWTGTPPGSINSCRCPTPSSRCSGCIAWRPNPPCTWWSWTTLGHSSGCACDWKNCVVEGPPSACSCRTKACLPGGRGWTWKTR